jgi:hypothetical protein
MRKLLFFVVLFLSQNILFAQEEVEMADGMRAEGKIYVVVAILVLILAGLISYLVLIDRKVGRLEKRLNEKGDN